jgi:hypothetical protein
MVPQFLALNVEGPLDFGGSTILYFTCQLLMISSVTTLKLMGISGRRS